MSSLKLGSTGGGSVLLTPANSASHLTVTVPAVADTLAVQGQLGLRNKIINGAMMIDQRNAGASVTLTAGSYTLDRWYCASTASSKFSVQQSTTVPAGFKNSLLITSLSAYSVAATDRLNIQQVIEGFNISDLSWGTANAKTITLSFQVYSSLTGTFSGAIQNADGNRSYPFTYSISSANSWTSISVTISGDTSGTWLTDNSGGITLIFSLGTGSTYSGAAGSWQAGNYKAVTGSVSVVGTNGATFYITGVQLEKGATATPFENRLYGTELALCQRYYLSAPHNSMVANQAAFYVSAQFPVTMRATPTVTTTATSSNLVATTYGFSCTFGGQTGSGYAAAIEL